MSARTTYDVSLSFAGEDRAYVEAVARHLRMAGVHVFYDAYEQAALWGRDLYQHLDQVYRNSRYCVIFVSEAYSRKLWTRHELRSAQARALTEQGEYILPARFDNTEIPGLPPSVAYIDLSTRSPEELTELILRKLNEPSEAHNSDIKQEDLTASARGRVVNLPSVLRAIRTHRGRAVAVFLSTTIAVVAASLLWQAEPDNTKNVGAEKKTVAPLVPQRPPVAAAVKSGDPEAIVTKILSQAGLMANFDVRVAVDVPVAAAVIENGQRVLLYDPRAFLSAKGDAAGANWKLVAVLAHEIGHHLSGHTLSVGAPPNQLKEQQLDADKFAGFALFRLGATLDQALGAYEELEISESASQPGKTARLNAIADGWSTAQQQFVASKGAGL